MPTYSVHDITRIGASKKKLRELVDRKIFSIELVPDDFALSEAQENQVQVLKSQEPIIDRDAIRAFAHIHYPVSFLDYETYPLRSRFIQATGRTIRSVQFSLDVVRARGLPWSITSSCTRRPIVRIARSSQRSKR